MTKRITLLIFSLIITVGCFSQYRFEIGVEGGPSKDYYEIVDPGGNLLNVPCNSGFGGINFRLNTKRKFYFELGFLAMENTIGLTLKQHASVLTTNHNELLLFPLRVGYPVSLSKRFSVVPNIGSTAAVRTNKENVGITYNEEVNSAGFSKYALTPRLMNKELYFLINSGVSMEWNFMKRLKACAGINYYQGLSKVTFGDVSYQINTDPAQSGQMIGRGTFLAFTFGVKCLIK